MNHNLHQKFIHLSPIMKNTLLALFLSVGTAYATESYSQNTRVTIIVNQASPIHIISEIEKQTDYLFVYDIKDINSKHLVSIDAKERPISEVLDKMFKGTDIRYAMEGKNIMLMKCSDKFTGDTGQQMKVLKGKVTDENKITGTIIDETGEPMIGVSVLVQGTTIGTITDLDGKFILGGVPVNTTLVISYIGYKTQNVKVGSQNTFAIKMESDNKLLDEVVVIGYQTIKRKDLTGSVASVTGKAVSAMPVSNVAQAMQGKLPGVNITSQDGRPDAAISIRVRGGGSISQSNEPLILVDGVTVNSLNDIPSDQVESIDVLKDASSTAIYGARGANGVILVTTKGAKEGKVSVSYNGYVKFNTPTKYLRTLDPYDYLT